MSLVAFASHDCSAKLQAAKLSCGAVVVEGECCGGTCASTDTIEKKGIAQNLNTSSSSVEGQSAWSYMCEMF